MNRNIESHQKGAVNTGQSAPDAALVYIRRGWNPTPVAAGTKAARLKEWQTLPIDAEQVAELFQPDDSIGLVLGALSGGLVCADLDSLDRAIAEHVLPATGMVEGRPSKPDSHRFYVVNDDPELRKKAWKSPTTGKLILELLTNGQQVVVAPSLHPSGEHREWLAFSEPAAVNADTLMALCARASAYQELVNLWPAAGEGRHHAALALAGGLLRAGTDDDEVLWLLSYLCDTARAGELENIVESTARKLAADERVTGWRTLAEQTSQQDPIRRIVEWLGVDKVEFDDRPVIFAGEGHLDRKTNAAWKALAEANDPPMLFLYGGVPVRIVLDADRQEHRTEMLTLDRMRYRLAEAIQWLKIDRRGDRVPANPPNDLVHNILAAPEPPLPVLSRIVAAPVYAANGELQTTPGYSAAARVYLDLAPGLAVPAVPERPRPVDIERARTLLLDELLVDFPFVSEADRAHAVALLLLAFGREFIAGPTPLHLIEAPTEGTGKDLLAQVVSQPVVGRSGAAAMTEARDEEEWRKRITTALMTGSPFTVISNVKAKLRWAALQQAVTTSLWADRVLSTNTEVHVEPRCVWVVTGNNVEMDGETARRVVRIRLDAGVERPFLRTDAEFKHELPGWAFEHRGELVWAALTLWRAWLAADCPRPAGALRLGSYEAWTRTMGGVLAVAGIAGFLENAIEFYEERIVDEQPWFALVEAWAGTFHDEPVRTKDLRELAANIEGFATDRRTGEVNPTSFGMDLTKRVDRVYGNYKIVRGNRDRSSRAKVYTLRRRDESKPWQELAEGAHPCTPEHPSPVPRGKNAETTTTQGPDPEKGAQGAGGAQLDEASPRLGSELDLLTARREAGLSLSDLNFGADLRGPDPYRATNRGPAEPDQ